jgi:hypothetical protein
LATESICGLNPVVVVVIVVDEAYHKMVNQECNPDELLFDILYIDNLGRRDLLIVYGTIHSVLVFQRYASQDHGWTPFVE